MDPYVEQHPLRGHEAADPQGVVEAVAAGALPQRLADHGRHVVAQDGEGGGGHVEPVWDPGPPPRAAPRHAGPGQVWVVKGPGPPRFVSIPDYTLARGARGSDGLASG